MKKIGKFHQKNMFTQFLQKDSQNISVLFRQRFTCEDPKSAKRRQIISVFCAFWILNVKQSSLNVGEIEPR